MFGHDTRLLAYVVRKLVSRIVFLCCVQMFLMSEPILMAANFASYRSHAALLLTQPITRVKGSFIV